MEKLVRTYTLYPLESASGDEKVDSESDGEEDCYNDPQADYCEPWSSPSLASEGVPSLVYPT